jgi:hypothetical protein
MHAIHIDIDLRTFLDPPDLAAYRQLVNTHKLLGLFSIVVAIMMSDKAPHGHYGHYEHEEHQGQQEGIDEWPPHINDEVRNVFLSMCNTLYII